MDGQYELEPVSEEIAVVREAEEACAREACLDRVPELADVEDGDEVEDWIDFLTELDDLREIPHWELGDEEWFEDECGRAVFIPHDDSGD